MNSISFTIRIYPNKKSSELLDLFLVASECMYNTTLKRCIDYFDSYSIQYIPSFNESLEWFKIFKIVPSMLLKHSFESARNGVCVQNGKLIHPQFLKNDNLRELSITNVKNTDVFIKDDKLFFYGIKDIKIKPKYITNHDVVIKNIRLTKEYGKYNIYLFCLLNEQNIILKPDINKSIGFDFSLDYLFVDSDGKRGNIPDFISKSKERINILEKNLNGKKYGSNQYYSIKHRIYLIEHKAKMQRKYFLHNLSRKIVNENDIISVESASLKEMKLSTRKNTFTNKPQNFSKQIENDAFYTFTKYLEYKANRMGKIFIRIDRYFPSSQLCSKCGERNLKMRDVSIKVFKCPNCGLIIDRDINAAINIKNEGIKKYIESIAINK